MKTGKKKASAFDCALNLLSYRPRARGELENALSTRKYPREEIESALSSLERLNYINDTAFMESWCYYRRQVSPRGRWLVRNELRQKGISSRDMDEHFDSFYPESAERECLREIVGKLMEKRPLPSEDEGRDPQQKLARKLYAKGFELSLVYEVMEELVIQRT